jgi:outer membrane autotransporter protein
MIFSKARYFGAVSGCVVAIAGMAGPAFGQTAGTPTPSTGGPGNSSVQSFFSATVCNNPPQGSLFRARCLETEDERVSRDDPNRFANISTNSESSLNPNQTAIAASMALTTARALAESTEERLKRLRDEDDYKPMPGGDTVAGFGPVSIFANVEGEWFDQSRLPFANERGFDGDRWRATLGADYRLSTASHLGVSLGYDKMSLDFDPEQSGLNFTPPDSAGGSRAKTISATVFATFALSENAWLDASAGYSWSDNDFHRVAIFQPADRDPAFTRVVDAVAQADGDQMFLSAGLGYDFIKGPLSVGPYVRGRYVRSEVDAYDENDRNNTGLALSVSRQKATSLVSILGVRSSYAISTSWGVIMPQVRFEYEHEFEDDARATLTRFTLDTRNTTFAVINDSPDRDYFNGGLGLLLVLPGGVMPYLDYEGLLGYSGFDRHRVTAGLRLEF